MAAWFGFTSVTSPRANWRSRGRGGTPASGALRRCGANACGELASIDHSIRSNSSSSAIAPGTVFTTGDEGGNPIALLALVVLAPIAAMLLQMSLSRSREFEADRSGARLIGTGEPLASALAKLDAAARRIPMKVDPAQAQKYIINPLTGRKMNFAKLFTTHPPTEERIARLRTREWAR